MKKTFAYAIALLIFFHTQCFAEDTRKVVVHINEPEKFAMLVRTINYMRTQKENIRIHVVVNGPAVMRLTKDSGVVRELLALTEWVGACSLAMSNNNVSVSSLSEGVMYIRESGFVSLVNHQNDGYAYIKI